MSGNKGRGAEESDDVNYLYHNSYCKLLLKIDPVQVRRRMVQTPNLPYSLNNNLSHDCVSLFLLTPTVPLHGAEVSKTLPWAMPAGLSLHRAMLVRTLHLV